MEENLPAVREATGYKGPAIVDTENVLIKELVNRKIADVAISSMPIRRYDHGMAQPAAFVMKGDGTVLFSWAIVPGLVSSYLRCFWCVDVLLTAPFVDEPGRSQG